MGLVDMKREGCRGCSLLHAAVLAHLTLCWPAFLLALFSIFFKTKGKTRCCQLC